MWLPSAEYFIHKLIYLSQEKSQNTFSNWKRRETGKLLGFLIILLNYFVWKIY